MTGERRNSGLIALVAVILFFSWGSTLVKLAETPGITIAFWRMILCAFIWLVIMRVTDKRWLRLSDLRAALLPGITFGLNIAFFFTGVTRTSIASAEFTGALTPLLVVPLGAWIFKERIRVGALAFGLVSFVGLALVLFNAPPNGEFSWTGVAWIGLAVTLWAAYLLSSRTLRRGRSVSLVMASMMPIATLVVLPLGLFVFPGTLTDVTGRSVVFIVLLAVITGTVAHGLMVYAQRSVPIGLISMLQVSQPALAVLWSFLFLDSRVNGIQIAGMALVLAGLATVTWRTQRAG